MTESTSLFEEAMRFLLDETTPLSSALAKFQRAAELGHARATYYMAVCHQYGLGTVCDYTESRKWCEKSAELGDALGIGQCILNGKGRPKDPETAFAMMTDEAKLSNDPLA